MPVLADFLMAGQKQQDQEKDDVFQMLTRQRATLLWRTRCDGERDLALHNTLGINVTHLVKITEVLIEEGTKARAHFQVWWALRNRALPKYHATMNDFDYVDFFHAANSGHYTLFLLSLAKLFDRDPRVAGISELKRSLRADSKATTAIAVAKFLKPHEVQVRRVMGIRNRSVVHNEHGISRDKVYELNGVTPNELRALIDAVCAAINYAARELGIANTIFEGDRAESATLCMLKTLERGAKIKRSEM